jgi:hypothetical protein
MSTDNQGMEGQPWKPILIEIKSAGHMGQAEQPVHTLWWNRGWCHCSDQVTVLGHKICWNSQCSMKQMDKNL